MNVPVKTLAEFWAPALVDGGIKKLSIEIVVNESGAVEWYYEWESK